MPDRTLLLQLDPQEASARMSRRDGRSLDRFGARDHSFHLAVNRAFAALAADEPDRVRLVNAAGSEEEVTARLLDALGDLS
jgi:dTMP kinase